LWDYICEEHTGAKHLYFDTNILHRWPHRPNDLYSLLAVAKWVGTELYMPKVVEDELEAQFGNLYGQ
jgi:hypothetical protein